jgi:hypothetical protein
VASAKILFADANRSIGKSISDLRSQPPKKLQAVKAIALTLASQTLT